MTSGFLVRLRPAGPWRIGPSTGARHQVDRTYHSDTLYSAVCRAFEQLGLLEDWLADTTGAAEPAARFSSLFPYLREVRFVPPPRNLWPPEASSKVNWRGARFVPVSVVQSLLGKRPLKEEDWAVDGDSGCLLPVRKGAPLEGPFHIGERKLAAVDRVTSECAPHSAAVLEFHAGGGLWFVVGFASPEAREKWAGPVKAAIRLLADSGFGGGRSRGWGRANDPEFLDGELEVLILPPQAARKAESAPVAEETPVAEDVVAEEPAVEDVAVEAAPVEETAAAEEDALAESGEVAESASAEEEAPAEPVAEEAAVAPEAVAEEPAAAAEEVAAASEAVPVEEVAAVPEEAPAEAMVSEEPVAEIAPEVAVAEPAVAEESAVAEPIAAATEVPAEVPAETPTTTEETPATPADVPEVTPLAAAKTEPPVRAAYTVMAAQKPEPEAPAQVWWLLSLFSPGTGDGVEWAKGNYALTLRGGRVESRDGWGTTKLALRMVEEGSVLFAPQAPLGAVHNVAPEGFAHPVYRSGFALSISIPWRVNP